MSRDVPIAEQLIICFEKSAKQEAIAHLCIGLGYTAVQTASGGIGLSYTMFDQKTSCTMVPGGIDDEGKTASDLLARLGSRHPVERSAALALVNALNYEHANGLPEDADGKIMADILNIGPGRRVAMVGAFAPLIKQFKTAGAELTVVDEFKQIGKELDLTDRLSNWAQSCIVTATALLNDTLDELLHVIPTTVPTVLLGPSTPIVPQAFSGSPVRMLAGTAPVNADAVLRAVRQGAGTRTLHRFSRKVYQLLDP